MTYDSRADRDPRHTGIEHERTDETFDLIAASKVRGTSVYNSAGDNLGSIDDLMIGKRDGRVAYAVLSFGGFLGIGEKYTPLPWHALTYDEDKGGYNIGLTNDQLRNAPAYSRDELSTFGADEEDQRVTTYYGGLGYPPVV
jgi:sporulation protein YlmC with PRC-barrel domain